MDICRELLQHGADPNSAFPSTEFTQDQHAGRETALHCALRRKSQNKVELILAHGGVVGKLTRQQQNVLEFAQHQGCSDDIMSLLMAALAADRRTDENSERLGTW